VHLRLGLFRRAWHDHRPQRDVFLCNIRRIAAAVQSAMKKGRSTLQPFPAASVTTTSRW